MHFRRRVLLPLIALVVAGCGRSSASATRAAKRGEFAASYCALAKPCTAGTPSAGACESAVVAALPPSFDEAAGEVSLKVLRAARSAPPACDEPLALAKAVPLDLPRAASGADAPLVLSIVLAADGTTQVDGKAVVGDEAVLPLARAAHDKNPDLRAVIKADSAVAHGRVIHVLDLLKQAQIGKIAFGVSPVGAP